MKSWLLTRCFVSVMALIAIQSCGDETTQPQPKHEKTLEELIAGTPKANEEAELAALWLSQALIAPDTLYDQMVSALDRLRSRYQNEIPLLGTQKFWHWWHGRSLLVQLDADASEQYRQGNFDSFDSLNSLFKGEIAGVDPDYHERFAVFQIRFAGLLNLDSLASYYGKISGVAESRCFYARRGDWPNLYPGLGLDGELTFLLRKAGGDCPAGCTENHFWYFQSEGDSVRLIGDFEEITGEDRPVWWGVASISYYRFTGRGGRSL